MSKQNTYSSYEYKRPLYYGKDSKLGDIVCSELYHSVRDITKTFIDCTKKDCYKGIKAVIDNPAIYKAMIGGTTISFFSNRAGAEYASNHDFTFAGIDLTSFIFEAIPHLLTSAYIFWTESRKLGRSRKDTAIDMFILGAVTIPLSVLIYRPLRNMVSDHLMYQGMAPEKATLRAQAKLIFEYMAVATVASNYALKKLGRIDWKEKAKKDIDNTKREISEVVDEVIENYSKQNHKRNDSSVIDKFTAS